MRVSRLALLGLVVQLGCSAPLQSGGVVVLPGADERAALLMRLGLLRVGDITAPAHAQRIARRELLPNGAAAQARVGDYLLENGVTGATVAAIDGTTRGGRLLDLWRKPGEDGLASVDTRVMGLPVVYETLRTGIDVATGASYIEVSGTMDRTASDLGRVSVATRYDLAPGVSAVFAHTQIKTEIAASSESTATARLFRELLHADAAQAGHTTRLGAATLGRAAGYFAHALSPEVTVRAEASSVQVESAAELPAVGQSVLVSRVLVPLERPDTLSVAVAEARLLGEPTTSLRVRLWQGERPVTKLPTVGLQLEQGAEVLSALGLTPCPPDSSYVLEVPRGHYQVSLSRGRLKSDRRAAELAQPEQYVDLQTNAQPENPPLVVPFLVRCPRAAEFDELP